MPPTLSETFAAIAVTATRSPIVSTNPKTPATRYLLRSTKTPGRSADGGSSLHAAGVNHRPRKGPDRSPAAARAPLRKKIADILPSPVVAPLLMIVIHSTPRRITIKQTPSMASRGRYIHNRIHNHTLRALHRTTYHPITRINRHKMLEQPPHTIR